MLSTRGKGVAVASVTTLLLLGQGGPRKGVGPMCAYTQAMERRPRMGLNARPCGAGGRAGEQRAPLSVSVRLLRAALLALSPMAMGNRARRAALALSPPSLALSPPPPLMTFVCMWSPPPHAPSAATAPTHGTCSVHTRLCPVVGPAREGCQCVPVRVFLSFYPHMVMTPRPGGAARWCARVCCATFSRCVCVCESGKAPRLYRPCTLP